MSNLLSEICKEIDVLAWENCKEREAIACKSRIKKLLIKYEAKENPNMKINEVAAELEAYKNKIDERIKIMMKDVAKALNKINTLENQVFGEYEEDEITTLEEKLDDLKELVGGIDVRQDEDTDRINKLEKRLKVLETKLSFAIPNPFPQQEETLKKYEKALLALRQILSHVRSGPTMVDGSQVALKIIMTFNELGEPVVV